MRDEHRKARLRHLIKTDYGSQAKFAKDTAISESRTSQAAGKKEPFAEDAATLWEGKLGLPKGWFNNTWPTPKEAGKLGVRIEDGYPATARPAPPPPAPAPNFQDNHTLTPEQWEMFQAFSIAATSDEKKAIIERYESLKKIAAQVYGPKNPEKP